VNSVTSEVQEGRQMPRSRALKSAYENGPMGGKGSVTPTGLVTYVASPSTTISRHRPSASGTGMPSTRCPHHSTVLQGSHGCPP